MIPELPTVEDELERKAMDELSRILHHYDTGRISYREMNLMLDTLWACVSGLTPEDWREMIEEARRIEDDRVPFEYHAVRLSPYSLVTLRRDDESVTIIIRNGTGGSQRKKHHDLSGEVLPAKLARNRMRAAIKELTNGGFQPL